MKRVFEVHSKPARFFWLALHLVVFSGCGYKAPPSPLFDESERFGDQLEQQRKLRSDKAREAASSSPAPNVFWPTPAPSSAPRTGQAP